MIFNLNIYEIYKFLIFMIYIDVFIFKMIYDLIL